MVQALFVAFCLATFSAFIVAIYFSYLDYIDPKNVHGRWIEIGTANYNQDTLELNSIGVFRNQRLIATRFEFDGKQVVILTGAGKSIYQLAGTFNSPQLRRIQPNSPTQRFIKQGFEHTVDMEGGGIAKRRRAALAEHFSEK
ncbi:DUF2850 domain-containing protein [Vibrio scophthalmi]|uniref:DUF2850 domain-containing protein n=1 Tax=Vibrio scophthalmi TaxID=45658 RepID=UPI00080C7D54|nr:DUF2850 domain-containing protein [Vibrio scophthalmi]